MSVLVAQSDYNISSLYYFQGDHTRAIEMLRATRDECRKANDDYHVALCQLDLSEIYLELNQSREAAEMADQAVSDFQRLGLVYETGKSLANLALANWRQGRDRPALGLFRKARNMFVKERNRVWPSRIDIYRAIILIEQGQYAEGRRLCHSALRAFRSARVAYSLIQSHLLTHSSVPSRAQAHPGAQALRGGAKTPA